MLGFLTLLKGILHSFFFPYETMLFPLLIWFKPGFGSGGGSTESQYLSKSTNNQINIYFSKSRSNTMTTILK